MTTSHSSADQKGFSSWCDGFMRWGSNHALAFKAIAVVFGWVLTGVLALWTPKTFEQFDERSDALTWNLSKSEQLERRVVVVDIDEKSVQALGPWPWSRQTMAKLVGALNEEGVSLKLFDIVMPESKLGDDELKAALTTGAPSIGGQIFSIDPNVTVKSGALTGGLPGPCAASSQEAFGFIGNEAYIGAGFALTGHLTPVIDPDGSVRKVPAFVCYQGQSYPALSVAALMQLGQSGASNSSKSGALVDKNISSSTAPWWVKGHRFGEAPWTLKFKNLPDFSLPLNDQGQLRVSYRTPRGQFASLSAVDVIEHRVPKDMLNGVWALVGSTAFGAGDAIPTPHGGAEGGLEVHAQLIAAALDERTPFTPVGSSLLALAWVVLGSVLLLSLSLFSKPKAVTSSASLSWSQREWAVFLLPVVGALLFAFSFAVHAWGLLELNQWWGWSMPATVLAVSALMLTTVDLAQLRWQRTRLFENLSSYLSESAAQAVALSNSSDEVIGQQVPVSVMSINLRNFDRFCASQEASLSAQLLHDYLVLLNDVIQAAGGQVQHVQGAEVLAVWTEDPVKAQSGHYDHYADRLLGVTQTLWRQSQTWLKAWGKQHQVQVTARLDGEFDDLMGQSVDPIRSGAELELEVGLESGMALMGSVGPKERRIYTVLGEPVQVAQSLRSMCAELAYPVLLGAEFGIHSGADVGVGSPLTKSSNAPSKVAYETSLNLKTSSATSQKTTQVVHMTPVRLGEFLLPGTIQSKVVYAMPVEINANRLQLVDAVSLSEKAA